jgi:hypothetical protein
VKIQVITSCTGEKLHSPENQLTQDDFRRLQEPDAFAERERELAELNTNAEDLYTGQQHLRLMDGVRGVRESFGADNVELFILSAGYGLIGSGRGIVPYECTFQGMKKGELRDWAEHLKVGDEARRVFRTPADFTLVLLGDPYLRALALDDEVEFASPVLFFASEKARAHISGRGTFRVVPLSNQEAKRFSCGLVGLKGELGKRILQRVAAEGEGFMRSLFDPASDVLALLDADNSGTPKSSRQAARENPTVDRVITIPESWWNKPHRDKLRYFIPEWDDLVDPDYDFETDTHSGGSGDWSNEVYAHQMYPEPNYDGILISKVVAERSIKKKERINRMGVHRFLRVPREFPVMGDCGAFGYIMDETPPYTTGEILNYYTRLGFDYGVSIDHLIVRATEAQKQFRYELTINNAEEFLREHRKRGLQWTPIGAVQGWDAQSYTEAARQYVAMGYKYIALGGLVRNTTADILSVLDAVHKVVPAGVGIHLFGLARFRAIHDFARLGVTSIDSASMLRQAWLGATSNFLMSDGWYPAFRIPQATKSFRAKRLVQEGTISINELQKLETSCLEGLRQFGASSSKPSTALVQALTDYDTLVAGERRGTKERILRTLEAKPWAVCKCVICQRWGVEVAIFRGNNRNRRRGFHNTFVFYKLIEGILMGERLPWLDSEITEDSMRQQELFEEVAV